MTKIDNLSQKYNNRYGADYLQQRALFRSYCHDTIEVFDDCFETSMLGMIRCIKRVETYRTKDYLEIDKAKLDIVDLLWNLKVIVKSMIPIKDLPSCKILTALSAEDIVAKAKDLVKNDIVKADVGIILLGSKVHAVVKIEDVKSYYNDRLNQLNSEILVKSESISPIEQFLLDKFNAEIGYCDLALFKAEIGIANELKDLAEISQKHIEKYEKNHFTGKGNLVFNLTLFQIRKRYKRNLFSIVFS